MRGTCERGADGTRAHDIIGIGAAGAGHMVDLSLARAGAGRGAGGHRAGGNLFRPCADYLRHQRNRRRAGRQGTGAAAANRNARGAE